MTDTAVRLAPVLCVTTSGRTIGLEKIIGRLAMETPLDVEAIRRRVAQRASDLTGVSVDEIARELAPVAGDRIPDLRQNWTLAFHGASKLVAVAVEQAIGEIKAEQVPLAGGG